MKKIIVVGFVITLIIVGFILIKNNTLESVTNDSDYYTELIFKEGSEQFIMAANFLMLNEEKLLNQEVKFFLYEKDNRKELHAKIKASDGNCNIHAREIIEKEDIFQNASFDEPFSDIGLNSESHSCTGNPCSSCRFTRKGGSITGCKCSGGWGVNKCNHTVTANQQ